MSTTVTLPDMELTAASTAVSGTVQWRLESFQVVNWGGFAGVHTLWLDPISTLLSGQSGTGKSTILDANIALLMPASTAFNGASNDAGGGRARGEEQRSLLSYLRGQIATTSDGDNTRKAKILRGDGRPTWGAIAARYVSDTGHRFTVLRAYYVPAGATRDRDLVARLATYDGAMDLSLLDPLAQGRFQNADLKAAFPGLVPHDTYAGFSDKVCSKLNIGAGGDGAKALALLARIQAGRMIRSVDELYKQMVLEEPATFAAADLALAHFDELDDTYQQMVSERHRASLLEPLPSLTEQLRTAEATIDLVAGLGLNAAGRSPLSKWETDQESTLAAAAERAASADRTQVAQELADGQRAAGQASSQHSAALAAFNAGGGHRLLQIDLEIRTAEQERTARENQRETLTDSTAVLGLDDSMLDDRARFAELRATAGQWVTTFSDREAKLDAEVGAAAAAVTEASRAIEDLGKEIQGAKTRQGRVPKHLDDQRMAVCEATGLGREDLPFVAELLDVPADQEMWRTAIEVSLAAAARLMLVPQDRIGQVSAAIDRMRWNHRMRFEAVSQSLPLATAADPSTVAGKLVLADSPFAGWVSQHITDQRRNAVCVLDAAGLNGPGMRVTAAGQTRQGASYAHGRNPNERNIIGFDNAAAIADLERDRDQAEERRGRARGQYDKHAKAREALRAQNKAYDAVLRTPFDDIDLAGCDATIAKLGQEKEELRNSDQALAALSRKLDRAQEVWEAATKAVGVLEKKHGDLTTQWEALIKRADQLTQIQMEHDQLPPADPAALQRLQELWELATTEESRSQLGEWAANRKKLREALTADRQNAATAADHARSTIEGILRTYQELYYDPDLSTSVDGVGDFLAIYERILATGLAQRTQQWRDQLLKWSGEDLVPLTQALARAVTEVKNRLHPINDILRKLPFGATADRLQIDLRHVQDPTVLQFRRRLTELSSGATRDLPQEQMGARFKELKDFMELIRSDKDPRVNRNVADRSRLLDVRRHVHVTAKSLDSTGLVTATYDWLGDKSGGETQELIAFIVGAALRYRLGDQLRDRPRFAPVFLDEAFIKADAEFSSRAVNAWLGLGFQLIVGAPSDKVTALEPHMQSMVSVTKNHITAHSYLTVMNDDSKQPAATIADPQSS